MIKEIPCFIYRIGIFPCWNMPQSIEILVITFQDRTDATSTGLCRAEYHTDHDDLLGQFSSYENLFHKPINILIFEGIFSVNFATAVGITIANESPIIQQQANQILSLSNM